MKAEQLRGCPSGLSKKYKWFGGVFYGEKRSDLVRYFDDSKKDLVMDWM